MRYTIPVKETEQKKERDRILRAAASDRELSRMQQALDWMFGCAKDSIPYDNRKSYQKLYDIYKILGITEGKKEAVLFPAAQRSADNFKEQLLALWRILQVYAQKKTPTLLSSYRKYQKDQEKYDSAFRKFDGKQKNQWNGQGMPEPGLMDELPVNAPEQENAEHFEEMPPLADDRSPYASLIKGSVYSELYGLYKNLQPQLRPGRNLADRLFREDMHQLLSKMQLHYLRRNQMGNVLPMTKDERRELSELYRDCLRGCQRLPEKLKKKQEYKKLHSLLSKNENQLRHLPKDALVPLADVIRGLNDRPLIRLIAQERESIGKAMSDREAVEYIDAEGNIRRGFFTAERKLGKAAAELDGIVDKYDRQYPQYSDYFKKIKSIKNDDDFQLMLENVMRYYVSGKTELFNREPIKDYFQSETDWFREPVENQENFWKKVVIPMVKEMAKSYNIHGVMRESGIRSNDFLAERASAMSDMANSLGYPDLLVGTQLVTVKRGDRTETGVMMEAADMDLVDPAKITESHPFYNLKSTDFDSRQFLSSLADLQILDYLCANTDRHSKNFFFRMDIKDPKNPKLLGVQGIDNDNSFGDLEEGGAFHLAKSSNLKIITPKMAAAVKAMTPKQLKVILKPYHLSKLQLEAAEDRLSDLQDMIKRGNKIQPFKLRTRDNKYDLVIPEGTIYTIKEADWEKLRLKALLPKAPDESNIFYFANGYIDLLNDKKYREDLLENLKKANDAEQKAQIVVAWNGAYPNNKINADGNFINQEKKEEEPAPLRYTKQEDKLDYEKLARMHDKELADLNEMLAQFNRAHGSKNDEKRSREFKAMRAALVALISEYREMDRLNPDKIKIEDQINPQFAEQNKKELEKNRDQNLHSCYQKIEEKRQNLKQAVDTYLAIWHWKRKPTENNQKRINTAKQLSGLVMDAPSSEQFYKSSISFQDAKRERETVEDPFEQGRYLTNEIHSRMKLTLRDNVSALKPGDRGKGLEAMEAHERLWNYSQSQMSKEAAFVKTTREKTSLSELLAKENWKKQEQLLDKKQICADLVTIFKYAEEKNYASEALMNIKNIVNEKEKTEKVEGIITPRYVGGILSELFIYGSKERVVEKGREKADVNKQVNKNDICTTM